MSASEQPSPSPTSSRHRNHASLYTTASGIADSVISASSFVTGESLRLSRFPPPPTSIPPSPIVDYSKGGHSPTTPTSRDFGGSPWPSPSRANSSPSIPSPVHASSPLALYSKDALPSPTQAGPSNPPPTPNLGALPPVPPFRFPPPRTPPERPGQRDRRDITEQVPSSPKSQTTLSPYDWHEGSSSISVDPSEERLLSTAFITNLLAPARSAESSEQHNQDPGTPSVISSSGFSEISYPPPSTYGLRNPNNSYTPSPLHNIHEHNAETLHAPPPSYEAVDHSRISPSPSNITFGETDGAHSDTYEADPAVDVRTAPRLARKVSLIGITSAELQHLPPPERRDSASPSSGTGSNPFTFDSSTPLFPRDGQQQRPLSALHEVELSSRDSGIEMDIRTPEIPNPPANTPGSRSFQQSRERRQSSQSNRSTTASSFISRLSNSAVAQRSARMMRQTRDAFRVKPLPPVPMIANISVSQEQSYRRMDDAAPLPQLAQRADMLNDMLGEGRLPHQSVLSYDPRTDTYRSGDPYKYADDANAMAYASGMRRSVGGRKRASLAGLDAVMEASGVPSPSKEKGLFNRIPQSRRTKTLVFSGILVALIIIAIVVGVVVGRRKTDSGLPSCSSTNVTGSDCDINATCVCTSTTSCTALAQNIVELTPSMNTLFDVNYTTNSVAAVMFTAFGSPVNSDCRQQAIIVDTAPGLSSSTYPNRTTWAQAALLWSFVRSQNTSEVAKLQDFVQGADWSILSSGDGPVSASSTFETTVLGYTFDFAAQTVTPPETSFQVDGQPSSSQISQVSDVGETVLDRMYAFAHASSTQRATAMASYWVSELQQDASQFSRFVSLVKSAPILLPFDATSAPGGQNLSSLLTNSTSDPFPPPLSCYPGLTTDQTDLLNSVETSVFGLGTASSPSTFDSSCYPNRPIYGVLDILQLRLPFPDSTSNVSKQAAVLHNNVSPRAIVYSGGLLSALPDGAVTTPSSSALDPREFGTVNHLCHVLLNLFTAIPDINVARSLAKWVLQDSPIPPSSDTVLGQSLDSIPLLEVAVFGSVVPSDVAYVVSSLATPSGDLFFGSDASLALRDWAIDGTGTSVAWTDSALASEIVDDNSLSNDQFNAVWDPAFAFFHTTNDAVVNVSNITSGFTGEGLFTPSISSS